MKHTRLIMCSCHWCHCNRVVIFIWMNLFKNWSFLKNFGIKTSSNSLYCRFQKSIHCFQESFFAWDKETEKRILSRDLKYFVFCQILANGWISFISYLSHPLSHPLSPNLSLSLVLSLSCIHATHTHSLSRSLFTFLHSLSPSHTLTLSLALSLISATVFFLSYLSHSFSFSAPHLCPPFFSLSAKEDCCNDTEFALDRYLLWSPLRSYEPIYILYFFELKTELAEEWVFHFLLK